MTFDNTDTFALFKHDKKGNDNAPDLSGKINISGRELRLAAWIKRNEDGSFKLYSGKVTEFQTQVDPATEKVTQVEKPPLPLDGFEDPEIPF